MSDMKLIMENWNQFMNEAELAPAMYDALKASGKLPPGTTRKGGDAPSAAAGKPAAGKPAQTQDFDTGTGEPLTKKGEQRCAQDAECYKKYIHPVISGQKFSTRTGQPAKPLAAIAQKAGHGKLTVDDDTLPKAQAQAKPQKQQAQKQQAQKQTGAGDAQKKIAKMKLLQKIDALQDAGGNDMEVLKLVKQLKNFR